MKDKDTILLEGLYTKILLKENIDEEYLRLAQNPEENKEALQRMVDDAARMAGYRNRAYHYTAKNFYVFEEQYENISGFYFSPIEAGDKNRSGKTESTKKMDVYLKMDNPIEMDSFDSQDISPIQKEDIIKNGFDSVIGNYDGLIFEYVVFNPSEIKLADHVTYDDEGNVIPLSQRFDADNNDIRY